VFERDPETGAIKPALTGWKPVCRNFREIPAVLGAFDCLEIRPDLLMCDGQGIAHPRRFGMASHLGI